MGSTCASSAASTSSERAPPAEPQRISSDGLEVITVGAGCFWCVEAVMQRVIGVKKVESGYMGGPKKNPTYNQVCSGTSGHAEAVQVWFSLAEISIDEILEIFFKLHDPTTKDRQGNDVGSQYRSVIFYRGDAQLQAAKDAIAKAQPRFDRPIVTEVSPATEWFKAEGYHQEYYNQNSSAGYCRYVIHPKLQKIKHDKFQR